jgi:ParB family transcriptional regulator, chromosome partitioning protein
MATKKPKGLGLGLQALLGPTSPPEPAPGDDGLPRTLRLDQIAPGRYQPRTRMDEGSLMELADSIRAQGLMQPILVRPLGAAAAAGPAIAAAPPGVAPTEPRWEIIAGERRARAAQIAGLSEVPVLVKAVPDEAAAAMSLIENIQREDLNPLEEAQGLQRLISEFGLTHEQAAQAVGRSRSAATNLLRLLQLADPVQQWLMAGDLDMGHARALLPLDRAQQLLKGQEIVARRLSVRDAERLVQRTLAEGGGTPVTGAAGRNGAAPPSTARSRADDTADRDVARLEERLADALAAKVTIRLHRRGPSRGGGEIVIAFASADERDGLIERLGARLALDDA